MPTPDPLVRKVADALRQMESFSPVQLYPEGPTTLLPVRDFEAEARVAVEVMGLTEERGEFDTTVVRYKTDWMPRADS